METITKEKPVRWQDFVVPQGWEAFTEEDHAVWDLLFARQVELLGSRVVTPFLDGIDLLRLGHPGIPELGELNAILEPRTGWRTVAVPGLVPDESFFAMLASRVFPVGNFIRKREQLDIVPLSPEAQEKYSSSWRDVQGRFVDDPGGAVNEADGLVTDVMRDRGYPIDDFEQRADDISVDHPDVVQNYRAAHAVHAKASDGNGGASTEDLRQGFVHYRALFTELLEAPERSPEEANR